MIVGTIDIDHLSFVHFSRHQTLAATEIVSVTVAVMVLPF